MIEYAGPETMEAYQEWLNQHYPWNHEAPIGSVWSGAGVFIVVGYHGNSDEPGVFLSPVEEHNKGYESSVAARQPVHLQCLKRDMAMVESSPY